MTYYTGPRALVRPKQRKDIRRGEMARKLHNKLHKVHSSNKYYQGDQKRYGSHM
jgi:hypothetical protein